MVTTIRFTTTTTIIFFIIIIISLCFPVNEQSVWHIVGGQPMFVKYKLNAILYILEP